MCVTLSPAKLSNTILYAGETMLGAAYVHLIGYQNQAHNVVAGPNAMILPFPSSTPMGPGNVFDTTQAKSILKDLTSVIPRRLSRSKGTRGPDSMRSVQVFDSGSYTIVMSRNARAIPAALDQVPVEKRPTINGAIFDAYAQWYPNWPIALCCFAGEQEVAPEPMLWWYNPLNPDYLFIPGLDAHDGQPPRLGKHVEVASRVVFGSTLKPMGTPVIYSDVLSPALRTVLPPRAVGVDVMGLKVNGDYLLPVELLHKGAPNYKRLPPPGAGPVASAALPSA